MESKLVETLKAIESMARMSQEALNENPGCLSVKAFVSVEHALENIFGTLVQADLLIDDQIKNYGPVYLNTPSKTVSLIASRKVCHNKLTTK